MRNFSIGAVLLVITCSCNQHNSGQQERQFDKGYMIYFDSDHWYFVPLGENVKDSCSFATENLGKGFQFTPNSYQHIAMMKNGAKRYRLKNVGADFSDKYDSISIVPVSILCENIKKKTDQLVREQPHLTLGINNQNVRFDFDFVEVDVLDLALRCTNQK